MAEQVRPKEEQSEKVMEAKKLAEEVRRRISLEPYEI